MVAKAKPQHGRTKEYETAWSSAAVRLCLGLLLVSAVPFGVNAYNAGYGYDQLEYLVIGRSLIDGFALYDFVPSKSPGIYLFVAALLRCGLVLTHVQLACVISYLYAAILVGTFVVTRAAIDSQAAVIAAGLTGLCAWFMELGFLQPTGFVYLFGLAGYWFCTKGVAPAAGIMPWFLSGGMLALGFQFKSVAAFYGVAAASCVLLWRRDAPWSRLLALAVGALLPTTVVALYFAFVGRAHEYWEWTLYFPLFKYPSNTYFLFKVYTKLLFFIVVFVGAALYSLRAELRPLVFGHRATVVALIFGVCSLLALLKSQASHYCFPAAGFLSIFTARVIAVGLRASRRMRRRALVALAMLFAVLLCGSAYLYSPVAIRRLWTLRRFDEEQLLAVYLRRNVGPREHLVVFRASTLMYWLSHRYPNMPLINMEVQSTYFLETRANVLAQALRDPTLKLVEFDPDQPQVEDPMLLKSRAARVQLADFAKGLERRFVRDVKRPASATFWVSRVAGD